MYISTTEILFPSLINNRYWLLKLRAGLGPIESEILERLRDVQNNCCWGRFDPKIFAANILED